jgi:type IX secretion system PorP/SprF family membrane protein
MHYKNISGSNLFKIVFITTLFTIAALQSQAQLDPFQSMFYQNRYLLNPALAGINKGLNINVDYQQQWSAFPGTPKTDLLTGDYAATDKVGIGVNISDDQSGIIRTTKILGSYAYHLRLDNANEQHLSFGLSLGINNSRVDLNKVSGDLSDEQISIYNQLKPYIDGDLGVAYTDKHWLFSGTVPNLGATVLNGSDDRFTADQLLFVGEAAYKIDLRSDYNNITLEPMGAYRIVKGYKDIIDAGVNLAINNYGLNVQAIYHTNQNMSLGVGLDLKTLMLMFNYNIETGPLSNFTNGSFELGMRFHFL